MHMDAQDLRGHKVETQADTAYSYESDLNVRDEGDGTADPAYNDFYKGYAMDPYAWRQWAERRDGKHLTRTAVREVVPVPGNVDQLADYVLMLWQRLDGTLQDFFDGFTLRYPNTMKRALAKAISDRGYTVYPVLTDDRVYYAKRLRGLLRTASTQSPVTKLRMCCAAFTNSEGLRLCLGEVEDELEMGTKVDDAFVNNLLEYYTRVFPQDYALALTVQYMNDGKVNIRADHFQDYNLSDEALQQIERMMSGNQDPYYPVHDGGGWVGWDYVGDMRGQDGVRPERYELPAYASRLVKKNN